MAQALDVPILNPTSSTEAPEAIDASAKLMDKHARLRHFASNMTLALLFFAALVPGALRYETSIADYIWLVGAMLMGLFSLVRIPPKVTVVSVNSIAATAGMMILPTFVTPNAHSTGLVAGAAIVIEIIGVAFTQTARVFLGRSFGLLPANRGIVTSGPFQLVRHPIYIGWLILMIGYVMVHPTVYNVFIIVCVLPFMMWRIVQEEELLRQDAKYEAYCQKVRYRLIPGVF